MDEIDGIETISNAMRLARVEELSSVILELTPGKSWQYSRSGMIMAQEEETSVVIARSKGTRYAICVPSAEGMWLCSIVDTDGLPIKEIRTRL